MAATKTTGAGGRVVIEEAEGAQETRFSPVLDCAQASDWIQVWTSDVGDFDSGQLEVSAQIQVNSGAAHTAIEVRAIGYLGPLPTVIATWALGGNKHNGRRLFALGDAFDRVALEARLMVNGAAGPGAFAPASATLSAALKLWR